MNSLPIKASGCTLNLIADFTFYGKIVGTWIGTDKDLVDTKLNKNFDFLIQ